MMYKLNRVLLPLDVKTQCCKYSISAPNGQYEHNHEKILGKTKLEDNLQNKQLLFF